MRNMRRARICPSYYYVQSSCRPCRASHRGVLSLQQKAAQHPKAQDSMYCLRVIPTPCCHSKRSLCLSVSLSVFLFPFASFPCVIAIPPPPQLIFPHQSSQRIRRISLTPRITPDGRIRPDKPLQAHIRRIDRTLARIQEQIIQQSTKAAPEERTHHRDPEIIPAIAPHLVAVAEEIAHESWPEVARQVDGVAGLPAEAGADAEDDEEETQGREGPGADVAVVLEGVDAEHEQRAGDEFGEELARLGHEGGGVGAEDAGGAGVAPDGADPGAAFEDVDRRLVVGVDDGGGAHGAEDLRQHVGGEFAPGELAVHAVGEGDGRVDMGTRDATRVDAEHDAEAPALVRRVSKDIGGWGEVMRGLPS